MVDVRIRRPQLSWWTVYEHDGDIAELRAVEVVPSRGGVDDAADGLPEVQKFVDVLRVGLDYLNVPVCLVREFENAFQLASGRLVVFVLEVEYRVHAWI